MSRASALLFLKRAIVLRTAGIKIGSAPYSKMNKAHLVVSQNFVFQNRASRSCKAHLHVSQNFVFRIVHAPYRWSLTGLFAMQTKNAGADEKTKLLPTSSRVMPIKGFHRNPPQWAEGMPVLLAYHVQEPPGQVNPASRALRVLDRPPVPLVLVIQQAMPPGNRAQPGHGSQWRSDSPC